MSDIPPEVLRAAVLALQGHPWPDGETTEAQIATLVLEAAAPLLADAWGVAGPSDEKPHVLLPLPAYVRGEGGGWHRHGTDEPSWVEHSHLGGDSSHAHDPETGMQVPAGGGLWPHEEVPDGI